MGEGAERTTQAGLPVAGGRRGIWRGAWCAMRAMIATACTGLALHAADSVPVQTAPTDDSMTAAKRQLDAMKANARAAAAAPNSPAAPQVTLPAMALPSSEPTALPLAPDAAKDKKRSENWLVDAMMRPDEDKAKDGERRPRPRRDTTMSDRDRDERRTPEAADETRSDERDPRHATSTEAGPDTRKPTNVANPLNRYMTDWLSPQDYALLQKTLESRRDDEGFMRNSAEGFGSATPGATVSDMAGVLGNLGVESFAGTKSVNSSPPPGAQNPYLQGIAFGEPPPAPPPAASPPSVFTSPKTAPEPPPPPPEQKPSIPDFAKPRDDDKFFKPLKRF